MFSSTQKRVLSYALTFLAVALTAAGAVYLVHLLGSFLHTIKLVLWPLAISGILCLLLKPLVDTLNAAFKMSRIQSIVAIYLVVTALLLLFFFTVVPILFNQIIGVLEYIPVVIDHIHDYLVEKFPALREFINEHVGQSTIRMFGESLLVDLKQIFLSTIPFLKKASGRISNIPAFIPALTVIPIYLFYFLETDRDYMKDVKKQINFINKSLREDILFLVSEFVKIIASFFRGQLLIAVIMGICFAIGFIVVGLKFSLILGLMVGLLNVIPYLGTIIGFAIVLPIAFFQPGGGMVTMVLALGVLVIVQIIEGYILTPKIMHKNTGLHPAVIIFSIFFWGTVLNGILGLILAIPLTAFFVIFWRLVREKHLEA